MKKQTCYLCGATYRRESGPCFDCQSHITCGHIRNESARFAAIGINAESLANRLQAEIDAERAQCEPVSLALAF